MAKQDDGLFLLEVLVDKITFTKAPCCSDKDFRTCVKISSPGIEPFEICDDDPDSNVANSGGPFVKNFNNGKSCLFSMAESAISSAMNKFHIDIMVYKALPCGCLPNKIVMGETSVDLTKEFVQARKKFLEDPNGISYQALKDSFRLTGAENAETGEISMFLRISCFGKLIITKFQTSRNPPSLGTGGTGPSILDRSCNPKRDFQTTDDPCVCGAARGGSKSGTCPVAKDPYNSMPCQDPDDPCFCSGPKPPGKQKMECRNTDKYCLHVPKGTLPRSLSQMITEDQRIIYDSIFEDEVFNDCQISTFSEDSPYLAYKGSMEVYDYFNYLSDENYIPLDIVDQYISQQTLLSSMGNHTRKYISEIYLPGNQTFTYQNLTEYYLERHETTVLALYDQIFTNGRCFGTQATAYINKCLQVPYISNNNTCERNDYSTSNSTNVNNDRMARGQNNSLNTDVYFFGSKRTKNTSSSKSILRKSDHGHSPSVHSSVQAKSASNSAGSQTKKARGSNSGNCTTKTITIQDDKKPCCPDSDSPGDMVAMVSYIKIGPKPCPVHGKESCTGPNCIRALASGNESVPVKVTSVNNPRKGVFELVIRKMTGAPLARNELMLEWTPPAVKPPPCGGPCVAPCFPPGPCRPLKCKLISRPPCKPKCCKPKCCKKPYPMPCRPSCRRPCKKPCPSCSPCPPPRCRPCPPAKCRPRPCRSPCKPCPPPPCRPCPPSPCKPCPPWPFKPTCPPTTCFPCLTSPCKPCPPPRCRPCPPLPCGSCCKRPCGPVRPCGPCPPSRCPSPPCRPCPPPPCPRGCNPPCGPPPRTPCKPRCCRIPCGSCCGKPCSSPCLRPCPVGRKKHRRSRSHPRIKPHRKRVSPCLNSFPFCPVVRCRSGPCLLCCGIPRCPPRKCCSISSCSPC